MVGLHLLLTPPFQSFDENLHFFKAYQVSTGRFVSITVEGQHGHHLPARIADLAERRFPPLPDPTEPVRFDPRPILAALGEGSELGPERFVAFPNMVAYPPTMYAPQAAGIWLARQLGASPLGQFYAGRLANAAFGVLVVLAAVALAPFGKAAILAVALLPTTPFLLGSMSADAIIIALGLLVTALAMRASLRLPLGAAEAGWTLPAVSALVLSKGVYLPIAAAGLPARDWQLSRRQWLLAGAMALGVLCFLAWLSFGRGAEIQFSIVSRRTLERTVTARPAEQLGVILAAPAEFLRILALSFAERLPVYVLQVLGRLGWNTILLPLPAYGLALAFLLLAIVAPWGPVLRPRAWQRVWWVLLALGMTLLVETALYLTGTRLGAGYVQGVQGRYFLPFLALPLLAASWPLAGGGRAGALARVAFPAAAVILNVVALAVVFDAFWVSGVVRLRGL